MIFLTAATSVFKLQVTETGIRQFNLLFQVCIVSRQMIKRTVHIN